MRNPGGGHKVSLESALILGDYLEKKIPTIPKKIWAQKLQAIKRHSNHAKSAAVAGTVDSYLEGMVEVGAPGQACLHSPFTTQA